MPTFASTDRRSDLAIVLPASFAWSSTRAAFAVPPSL